MTTVIDMHCHMVPAAFPTGPATCCAQWPSMDHRGEDSTMMKVGDKDFRALDSRSWDTERRIRDMDGEGVGLQVLSPMPELFSYWLDIDSAVVLTRYVNREIAGMVARAPNRFAGMGIVPLQDPQRAAQELAVLQDLGLVGVEIGSNILGRSPGEPFFHPFYAEAERRGLAIFVHALRPTMPERILGPNMVSAFVGFPTEVGLAAASFLSSGVLDKFPRLRIAFSHGGGTLAAFLPRLAKGWERTPDLQAAFSEPRSAARRLFYDNVVFDEALLGHLVQAFGSSQLCVGSDYPFSGGQQHSQAMFDALDLTPSERDAVLGGNAARYLSLNI